MCLRRPNQALDFITQIFLFLMLLYRFYYHDHNGKAAYSPFVSNKYKHTPKHIKGKQRLGNAASQSLDEVIRVETTTESAFDKAE